MQSLAAPTQGSTFDGVASHPLRVEGPPPRRGRLFGLFLVAAVIASILAYRAWRAHPIVLDDSYISLRYAENFAHGHGLVYNVGDRVEGYTNFLWVLFAAAAIKCGANGFDAVHALGILSYHLVVVVCVAFVLFEAPRSRPANALLLPLVALLFLPEGYAAFAGTGMETHFVALTLVLLGLTQHVVYPRNRVARGLVAMVPLLVTLTRLDAGVFVVSSALATLIETTRKERSCGAGIREVSRRLAPWALGMGAFMTWRHFYYGDIFPNTYYAKAADVASIDAGIAYLTAFGKGSPHVVLLLPVALFGAVSGIRSRSPGFSLFAFLGLILFAGYVVKVGGDFMHYRFFFEVFPIFFCLAVLGLRAIATTAPAASFATVVLAAMVSTAPSVMETQYHQETMEQMNNCCGPPGVEYGKRLRAVLPADTVISTTMAGGMPYYSQLVTIDQLGLTDSHVAHSPHDGPVTRRGHVKFATNEYLQSRGVNLVIGHPYISSCRSPAYEGVPNVFIRLEGDDCLRAWYMTPTPKMTAWLCAHRADFILSGGICPGPVAPSPPRPPWTKTQSPRT